MRGKDKVDYCVTLQIEHVTVLKNMSRYSLLSVQQNLQLRQLKPCRQAPTRCHFQTSQSEDVIYLDDRK